MLLLALVAAVALAASACSSSSVSGDAIVVNGVGLSNADFQKRLDLIKADATYAKKAVTDSQGQAIDLTGDAAGTYNTDFTTGVLNQQVSFVLAEQEVANRGIEVTDTDIPNAETALANDLTTTTATDTSGSVADDGTGAAGPHRPRPVQGRRWSRASPTSSPCGPTSPAKLSTDEALQKAFDESGDTYKNQACASVILLLAGQGPTQDPTTGATVPPPDSDFADRADQGQRPVGPAGRGRRLRHPGQVQLGRLADRAPTAATSGATRSAPTPSSSPRSTTPSPTRRSASPASRSRPTSATPSCWCAAAAT